MQFGSFLTGSTLSRVLLLGSHGHGHGHGHAMFFVLSLSLGPGPFDYALKCLL